MFESNLALVVNPQLLNKFEESKTTQEMVEKAIEKGYRITGRTPLFLFKYDAIIDLVLANFFLYYSPERMEIMLKNDLKRKEVIAALAKMFEHYNRYDERNVFVPDEYYGDIEINESTSNLIQYYLGIKYLEYNPEYVYSEFFDFNKYDKDTLFEFFKTNNIDLSRVKIDNVDQFVNLFTVFPEVLKMEKYNDYLKENVVLNKVISCIENGILTINNVPDVYLSNKSVMQALIFQDLNLINKFKHSELSIDMNKVVSIFVNGLPDSLKYMEELSNVENSYYYFDKYSNQILTSIISSGFLINDCNWSFISSNEDLMLDQFEKNPNIINTCNSFLSNAYLNEEQYNKLYNLLNRDEVEIKIFLNVYRYDERILKLVNEKNPHLLSTIGVDKNFFGYSKIIEEIPITPSSAIGRNFESEIEEAVRMNPDNYFAMSGAYQVSEELKDNVYMLALEHRRNPYRNSSRLEISKDSPLVQVDYMRLTGGPSYKVSLSNYSNDFVKNMFIIANYPDMVNDDSDMEYRVTESKKTIFKDLLEDFSNYYVINHEKLTEEELIELKDLFYKSKDKLKNISDNVYKNPYVFIEELLKNNFSIDQISLSEKQLEYFNKRFKELGLKCNSEFIDYIRDFNIFMDYGLKHGFEYVNMDWLNETQKNELFRKLTDSVLNGNLNYNYYPIDYFIEEFDFIKDYFDKYSIIKRLGDRSFIGGKNKEIYSYLRTNTGYISEYDKYEEFSDDELESLISSNVKYFKNKYKNLNENSPLYARKHIIEKVLASYIEDYDMDLIDLDYLLEHNKVDVYYFLDLYSNDMIDESTFKIYYLKILDNIKNGCSILNDGFEIIDKYINNFDPKLFEAFSLFDYTVSSDYLTVCNNKDLESVISYVINNHDKLSSSDLNNILSKLNIDDFVRLIEQCNIKVDSSIFNALLTCDSAGICDNEIVYKYWEMAGKPIENIFILKYINICNEIVSNDISLLNDRYFNNYTGNSFIVMHNVYKCFIDNNLSDVSVSSYFYQNDFILMHLNNIPVSLPHNMLNKIDRYNLILNLCKDNKVLFDKVFNYYNSFILDEKIEKDPILLMNVLNYKTSLTNKIIEKLKDIGYIPNKDTPGCYFCDSEFVKVFLDNNPEELEWLIQVLNENNITLSNNTINKYISDRIKEKGIYGEFKRVYYDSEYIIESLKRNIYCLDDMNGVTLDTNSLKFIYPFIFEKIKNCEYIVSEKTPSFIYYNDEIRKLVRETRSDLVENFFLTKLDNALDNSLMDKALINPELVDELFDGIDRSFSLELVDQLVEKLISMNYQITEKTPKFLLCNTSFVYYALSHNMDIDKKYIENFTTFENYYQTLDKELFIKLINEGYGIQMQSAIKFIGLDKTLEFASKYGYLLSVVPLSAMRNEEELIYQLLKLKYIDVFFRASDINEVFNVLNLKHGVYILDFVDDLISIYAQDINKHKEYLISLFRADVSPYNLPVIFKNQELYDLYIDSVLSTTNLIQVINYANENNLTKINILKAIKKGYVITDQTPDIIKYNEEYVELIIRSCRDKNKLIKMINSNKDIVLNTDAIQYLSNSDYVMSEKTPDVLLNNVSFIVSYLNRITDSSHYRTVINLLKNEKILIEVMNSIDPKKFILYFLNVQDESKKDIVDKYLRNINGKTDLLIKLILDGRNMSSSIRASFEDYFLVNIETMNFEQMEKLKDCLYRIEHSNSGEIRQFASALVPEVIKLANYEDAFNKIERIFLIDSLPMTKKLFLVFKVLNKDYTRFISEKLSPVLLNCATDEERDAIIYRDLVQSAFASNNRSVRDYLGDLDNACKLLEQYEKDNNSVTEEELQKVIFFLLQLINSEYIQSNMDKEVKLINDYDQLIALIKDKFNGYENLKDSVVQNVFGISTYDDAIRLLKENAKIADRENRLRAMEPFVLESGDFIKGIGIPNHLTNILQNGSVAKEFLGEAAGSDATPLDTDLSKVLVVGDTLEESIGKTAAASYGPIWFILKDGGRIIDTRKFGEEGHPEIYDYSKLESFHTGVLDCVDAPHYGIRTGFSSSQISYIVTDDKRVFLEVALNGFYIPVINKQGELIFTPEDYDKLRSKMSGLEYYDSGDYQIASKEDLMLPGVSEFADNIQSNREVIKKKHNAIKEVVRAGMESVGVIMKDKLDGNLMTGYADLIDTGSTARGTDLPGKADFDYICRVDRSLFVDKKRFAKFREAIMAQLGDIDKKEFAGDNFRFKGVTIPGLEEKVDLDISFVVRTTRLSLSSDESLSRVLDGIEQGNYVEPNGVNMISDGSNARDLVSANILMAKRLFKAYSCYKNHRNKDNPQGGLGGIGIENWILQNGGSLKLVAEEFLNFVDKSHSYNDFKNQYFIWDFGQNHYSLEDNNYSHDNFVYNNMDANGYARMVIALRNYLSMGVKAFDDEVIARIGDDVELFLKEKEKFNSVTI